MMRESWSDEQLSAFLDGELPEREMEALSRAIAEDRDLSLRVERLRSANAAYVDAIGEIDRAPLSAGLRVAVESPPAAQVIAFRPRKLAGFIAEHRAIAASLVCAAAVWGVMSVAAPGAAPDPFAPGPNGVILAGSPLHRLLESAPTGQAITAGPATAAVRLTFAANDGTFCRQVEVATDDSVSAAIACREDQTWRAQVAAYGLAKSAGDFQTASASRAPSLEAFLDERLSGAPMSAEEEAQLLSSGWARPRR